MSTVTSWVATFSDGPCKDSAERVFVVGAPWHEMYLMPDPRGAERFGWVLLGEERPEEPWPGQVHYRLYWMAGMSGAGEVRALYRQVLPE